MFEKRAEPGEYVIRQGDDGDNFYVIENGIFDVLVTGDDRVEKVSIIQTYIASSFIFLLFELPIVGNFANVKFSVNKQTRNGHILTHRLRIITFRSYIIIALCGNRTDSTSPRRQ